MNPYRQTDEHATETPMKEASKSLMLEVFTGMFAVLLGYAEPPKDDS